MNQVTIDLSFYDKLKLCQKTVDEISTEMAFCAYDDYARRLYVIKPDEATKALMKDRDGWKNKYYDAIMPKPKAPTRWQRLKKAWRE